MDSAAVMSNSLSNNTLPNTNDFFGKLTHSKEKTVQSLRSKLHEAKLIAIKEQLRKRDIEYDDSITDLNELKSSLKKKLSSISYEQVEDIYEKVNVAYDKVLNDLERGSIDATTRFIRDAEKITTPIAKSVAKGLAARTAIVLAPTIGSKVAIAGGLAAGSAYKLVKSKKEGQVLNQNTECDKMLQEMEVTYSDGKVIDTRFSSEIQDEIRKFLESKKIEYNDTGYLSLREQIYSLSFEDKLELCNLLNDKMNKGIDVNERIESKKGNFFDKLKNSVKNVRNSILTGVGVSAAVNTVDPAIIAGPINGTFLGTLISKLTDSKIIQGVTGLFGGVGSAVLERIPVVGDAAKSALAGESLLAGGIVGAGIGIAGLVAADIINVVKNLKDKFKYIKNRNEIMKYDSEKYSKDDKEEYLRMREVIYNKEDNLGDQAIFQLVYEYLVDDLNIKFINNPKNLAQLSDEIDNLSDEEKKQVRTFIDKLIDYNDNNHSDFVNGLIKGGKALSTIALLGLSGMSIYDLIKGGTFLHELSGKLFKNVPGNIYADVPDKLEIPEKGSSVSTVHESAGGHVHGGGGTSFDTPTTQEPSLSGGGGSIDTENISTVHESASGRVYGGGSISFGESNTNNIFNGFSKWFEEKFNGSNSNLGELFNESIDIKNGLVGQVEFTDKKQIEKIIKGMSDDELVNLAYYYTHPSGVNTSGETYRLLGEVMNESKNLKKIQSALDKYNETMRMVYDTGDKIKTIGETIPVAEEVIDNYQKVA